MFSAKAVFVALLAIATVAQAKRPLKKTHKRQYTNLAQHGIYYCTGAGLTGNCASQVLLDGECTEPPNAYNDNMLSVVTPLYSSCQFYADPHCQNQLASVTNTPGISSWVPYYNPNPSGSSNGVTSMRCTTIGGATSGQQVLSTIQVAPLGEVGVVYATDTYLGGSTGSQRVAKGVCAEIPQAFNDAISSFLVIDGQADCILYSNYFCTGTAVSVPYNGGTGVMDIDSLGDANDATTFICN